MNFRLAAMERKQHEKTTFPQEIIFDKILAVSFFSLMAVLSGTLKSLHLEGCEALLGSTRIEKLQPVIEDFDLSSYFW